jgi:hypothetical protein
MPYRYSRRKRDSLELREHRDETPGTSVPGVFVFEWEGIEKQLDSAFTYESSNVGR